MKKILLLATFFCCLSFNFISAQVYQNEREAVGAAKQICEGFGQTAKGGNVNDHTGVVQYSTSSSRENSTTGAQNKFEINGKGKLGTNVTGAEAGASYQRTGEQENSKNEAKRENSGYIYYKCE